MKRTYKIELNQIEDESNNLLRPRTAALAAMSVAVAMVLIMVMPAASLAQGGLAGSPHDFTDGTEMGPAPVAVGLCTFCHTPHRAFSTRLLWNHTLASQAYTWDEATTMGGTDLPSNLQTWIGPTRNCLSCHDGSVAIGDVAWFDKVVPVTPLNPAKHVDEDITVGQGGNLSGNHPVGVPFPFNNTSGETYNGITTGADVVMEWVPDPRINGIRLFVDSGAGSALAGAQEGNAGIECSSCHDPHNSSTVQDSYFLRGTLTGNSSGPSGYLCLKCHDK